MPLARLLGRHSLPVLAFAMLSLSTSDARALVIFDNFDPNGGFHPTFHLTAARSRCGTGVRAAAKFTVSGSTATLSSITLPIGCVQHLTALDNLRVRIVSDDNGRPGTTLEVLSENQDLWPSEPNPSVTILVSTTHPLLEVGRSYWIVTEPTSEEPDCAAYVEYNWHDNTSGTTALFITDVEPGIPTDPWINTPTPTSVAFRVEGQVAVDVDNGFIPLTYDLGCAGPMPFSQSTTLELRSPVAGSVSLAIYDAAGKRVRTLVREFLRSGRTTRTWDGRNDAGDELPAGLYFARLKIEDYEKTQKLLLVR